MKLQPRKVNIHSSKIYIYTAHWITEFLFYDISGVWPRWWLQSFHIGYWRRRSRWWRTRLATRDTRYLGFCSWSVCKDNVDCLDFSHFQKHSVQNFGNTEKHKGNRKPFLILSFGKWHPSGVPPLYSTPTSSQPATLCPFPSCLIISLPARPPLHTPYLSSQTLPSATRICLSFSEPGICPSALSQSSLEGKMRLNKVIKLQISVF